MLPYKCGPMPNEKLPACRRVWFEADGRIWTTDNALILWATPPGGTVLGSATLSTEASKLLRSPGERTAVVGPYDDQGMGSVRKIVEINGGAYDFAKIDFVQQHWPQVAWYAAPGIVARAKAVPATARVDGLVVAALAPCDGEPRRTPR